MIRTRLTPLALGAALVVAVAACGDDDPSASGAAAAPATTSEEGGDVDRYCALTAELDAKGEAVFADLPEDASADEVMAREREFLEQVAPQFDELAEVAPDAIRDDVPVMLDGIRARTTTGADPDAEASAAAEERILAFEEEHCS
jgi:hypothetical protein